MSVALARQAPYPVRAQQRRCGKCGKLVSRAAYACRRCGKSQKVRPRTILFVMSVAVLVAMFVVAATPGPQAHSAEAGLTPSVLTKEAQLALPYAHTVTAGELWAAYSHDAAAADRLYRDRAVAVSGIVRVAERDYEGNVVVRLGTGDAFDTVNATLATRNDPILATIIKGRPISLLCAGQGALMGAPRLSGCFIR